MDGSCTPLCQNIGHVNEQYTTKINILRACLPSIDQKTTNSCPTDNAMAEINTDTIKLTAQCLCKQHQYNVEVAKSKLPLEGGICHCKSCRHATGALTMQETTWPQPLREVDVSTLHKYAFTQKVDYYSCGTCSSPMFYVQSWQPDKLGVFNGVLNNVDADLIHFKEHIFVGDTIDGGASVWYKTPNSDGKEIPRKLLRDEDVPWDWPQKRDENLIKEAEAQDSIPFWCHCKGVSLRLHRGDYASKPREELPKFVDPRTNKLRAMFDSCDSCRLTFGNDLVNWTMTELFNITQADGSAFPDSTKKLAAAVEAGDPIIGSLAIYRSSPGVKRYHCKNCSASVFFTRDDDDAQLDVAVGLLDAPDGARAESFLSWFYGDVDWKEDTKGGWRADLMERIGLDAEEHRVATGYAKNWRALEKESEGMKS